MKKVLTYAFLAILCLNTGCVNRLFKYTVEINQTTQHTVDDPDGVFVTSAFINRTTVARALNLPSGSRVTELNIESLALSVSIPSTNQAVSVNLTGLMQRSAGGPTSELFRNQTIPLAGVNVPFIGLNALIADGIDKLKTELENFVKGIGTGTQVEIALSGTSTPAQRRVSVTIHVQIKATVKYERCEEVLEVLGDVGEPCP
jgi:hypothetical protein